MFSSRFAIAVALLAGSASFAAAQTTLRIGLAEDPDILDPTFGMTYVGRIVFASVCDKLFDIDAELNVVPQLALSHETSTDGKAVTIKLRSNVTFHDGEKFDAQAAKYSLDRHLNMPGSFRRQEMAQVEKVEVVDRLTVRLVLKNPFSPMVVLLADRAGMMVSPKAAHQAGDKFGLHPVCAGPFRFVARLPEGRIVVEKFNDYWNRDNIHIDRIIYRSIVESAARLAGLKSGDLDFIERLLATDMASVSSDPRLKLSSVIELGYQGLTINVGNGKPARNALGAMPKLRQALNYAIDRHALNDIVYNGAVMPGNQWVNPENPYYQQAFPVPKRDVAKAKALLEETGIATPIPVDFLVPNDPERQRTAEVLRAMAAEVGFDLRIRLVELAPSFKDAAQGTFQAYLSSWSGRADPDGNLFIMVKCGASSNYGGYCNPEVDKLLTEARTVSGLPKRKPIYEKITKILQEEGAILYLYHRLVLIAHTAKLEGYTPLPDGLIRVVGLRLK